MTIHTTNISAERKAPPFNEVVFETPARTLLETAPHIFTERGYNLEDIRKILDSHAYLGIEISHGAFSLGMDLADAHWDIIRHENIELAINIVDRPCVTIPKADKATSEKGKQLLDKYWDLYEEAKTIRGMKQEADTQNTNLLNILILRNELNAVRETFTCYAYTNTEGIADDMQDLWLTPLSRHSRLFKQGFRHDYTTERPMQANGAVLRLV